MTGAVVPVGADWLGLPPSTDAAVGVGTGWLGFVIGKRVGVLIGPPTTGADVEVGVANVGLEPLPDPATFTATSVVAEVNGLRSKVRTPNPLVWLLEVVFARLPLLSNAHHSRL